MGGFVIIMYLKKMFLKEECIKQSTIDNSPISKDLVDKLREVYGVIDYTAATEYLFGNSNIRVTDLTTLQAKTLINYAELLSIVTKKKVEKGITPKKHTKPYKNIWNTLER